MRETITTEEADELYFEAVAIQDVSNHRWYTTQLVVYKDPDGYLMGFYYLDPATEMQEDGERYETDPVEVFPVKSREIIHTRYEPKG